MGSHVRLLDGSKYEVVETLLKTDEKVILQVVHLETGAMKFAKTVKEPWCEVEPGGAKLQERANRIDPRVVGGEKDEEEEQCV